MGRVYFGVKFQEKIVNFPFNYAIKFQRLNPVVAFHKIHSHTLFATTAQVDVTKILYSVSMATLYSSVDA